MTLVFDQLHLGVPDPLAGAAWYQKYLGATPGDHADRVMCGRTRFIYLKNEAPTPSRGAAIGHVALSVPSLDAHLRKIEGSGGRVTAPPVKGAGGLRSCYIEDPWGASLEFVEDGRDGRRRERLAPARLWRHRRPRVSRGDARVLRARSALG